MIAPLTPLPIRGVLWYQGESNSALARVHSYDRVMRTLIEDWRRQWGVGDFPFLYVQISNFISTPLEDWAELREQQVRTLAMRNTAMAVTIDIGNPTDVHPTDKLDVGLRLARAARALTYGESVEYSGPMFRQATPEGGSIRAYFDHAQGLMVKGVRSPVLKSPEETASMRQPQRRSRARRLLRQAPTFPRPFVCAMDGPTARNAISSTVKVCPPRHSRQSGSVTSSDLSQILPTQEWPSSKAGPFLLPEINFELRTKNSGTVSIPQSAAPEAARRFRQIPASVHRSTSIPCDRERIAFRQP